MPLDIGRFSLYLCIDVLINQSVNSTNLNGAAKWCIWEDADT